MPDFGQGPSWLSVRLLSSTIVLAGLAYGAIKTAAVGAWPITMFCAILFVIVALQMWVAYRQQRYGALDRRALLASGGLLVVVLILALVFAHH